MVLANLESVSLNAGLDEREIRYFLGSLPNCTAAVYIMAYGDPSATIATACILPIGFSCESISYITAESCITQRSLVSKSHMCSVPSNYCTTGSYDEVYL